MPTTDELQAQINALQTQLNSILGMADDDYIHQYSGEEIDAGITAAGKAVRYDLAQSLSSTQQAQVRENIAAAPSGYGFGGEYIDRLSVTDGNESYESFCARLDEIMSKMPTSSVKMMRVYPPQIYGKISNTCSLIYQSTDGYCGVYNLGSPDKTCSQWRMIKYNGVWQPFEWINPPLVPGVEYRTTERYLGKPVYCKLVDFGKLPNNAIKEVAHGISNRQFVISVAGESNGNNLIGNMYITYVHVGTTTIRIKTNADRSSVGAIVLIKYTKTTD